MRVPLTPLIVAVVLAAATTVLAADDTPEMASVEGRHIILKVRADDLTHLSDPAAWVAKLDQAYEAYAELVGATPFDGEKITILSVEENPGGWAVAGNPIKWHRKHVVPCFENNVNKGDWCFGIIHEIGHDFDLQDRWNWAPELLANFKMDYVFEKTKAVVFSGKQVCDYGDPQSLRMADIYRSGAVKLGTVDRMLYGGGEGDGYHHRLLDIVGDLGWEPFQGTFRWFNSLPPEEQTDEPLGKRSLFIRVLEEQSGVRQLSDRFIDWGIAHLTADTKDAHDAARAFHAKNWNAEVTKRPIRTTPGAKVTVRVDALERKPITFEKGLGTHPYSECVYDLGGKYQRFESYVGVAGKAPAEGRWGSVRFEVIADAKKLYESPVLRGGGMYKQVAVDVAGAKELKLVVNDGGDGVWGDGCAWVDTKLIDAAGKVTYVSDLKPVSLKEGYGGLHLDKTIDDEPLTFVYGPCTQTVQITGQIAGQSIELRPGADPEGYEYTFDGFEKGTHHVRLAIHVGNGPITQHELVTVIVKDRTP